MGPSTATRGPTRGQAHLASLPLHPAQGSPHLTPEWLQGALRPRERRAERGRVGRSGKAGGTRGLLLSIGVTAAAQALRDAQPLMQADSTDPSKVFLVSSPGRPPQSSPEGHSPGGSTLKAKASSTAQSLGLKATPGRIRTHCFPALSSEAATPAEMSQSTMSILALYPHPKALHQLQRPAADLGGRRPSAGLRDSHDGCNQPRRPTVHTSNGLRASGSQVRPRRCERESQDSSAARMKRQVHP